MPAVTRLGPIEPILCLDGIVAPLHAVQSVAIGEGLLYGRGLFETLCVHDARAEYLDFHINRLNSSAKVVGLAECSRNEIHAAVATVIGHNHLTSGAIRITCLAAGDAGQQVVVTARGALDRPDSLSAAGYSATIAHARRNETSRLSRIKSLNYLDNILEREEARVNGHDEALFLNTQGCVADGAATNVFLVKQGVCITSPESAGALPGIMRGRVLHILKGMEQRHAIQDIHYEDLFNAEEVFLTSSLIGVMPLRSIDKTKIFDCAAGSVTERIAHAIEADRERFR